MLKRHVSSRRSFKVAFESLDPRQLLTALVSYNFDGISGKTLSQSGSAVTGLTSTAFARGPSTSSTLFLPGQGVGAGSDPTQTGSFYGVPKQSDQKYATVAQGVATAVTKEHYFTFKVTPASGKTLAVTGLDLYPFLQNSTSSGKMEVDYRLGSGSWVSGSADSITAYAGGSVSLFSKSLSIAATTSPIEFRIVVFGVPQYERFSLGFHSGNDVIVQGTVADAAPAAPSATDATSIVESPTQSVTVGAVLSWTDNSSDETGFELQRSTNSSFSSYTTFSVGSNVTTYSDTTAATGTTYYYRVKALKNTASSTFARVVRITPYHRYDQPHFQWMGDYSYDDTVANVYGAFNQRANSDYGTPDYDIDNVGFNVSAIAHAIAHVGSGGTLAEDTEFGHSNSLTVAEKIHVHSAFAEYVHSIDSTIKVVIYPYENTPDEQTAYFSTGLYDGVAPGMWLTDVNHANEVIARVAYANELEGDGIPFVPSLSFRYAVDSLQGSLSGDVVEEVDELIEITQAAGNKFTRFEGGDNNATDVLAAYNTFLAALENKAYF